VIVDLDMFRRTSTANTLRADQLLAELDRHEPELGAVLRQALSGDPQEFPAKRIATVIRQHGHSLSDTAIKSWRTRHGG